MKEAKASQKKTPRCWEFFHCPPLEQKKCLLSELDDWRCWLVDMACCKMDRRTPRPKSVKKVFCKTCAFFKTFKDTGPK
ncbi:MAG: hypothetical protein WC732_06570 [Candidatus Omnitrophota bacterium]